MSEKNTHLVEIGQYLRRHKLARASDFAETFGVTDRTIYRDMRALLLAYFELVWMLAAWCEARDDF